MLAGDKNLKDTPKDSVKDTFSIPAPYEAGGFRSGSYTKTNKLITALYMVTDIIDIDEPIRHKLRSLGAEIISDMHTVPAKASSKIAEAVSFLDIALAMSFISEMNFTVLKKEFFALHQSLQEHTDIKPKLFNEFFSSHPPIGHDEHYKGHQPKARIGVQKGSTLMKALSDRNLVQSLGGGAVPSNKSSISFDILKKQRRNDIITIIKNNGGSSTIKDIREKINTGVQGSLACSEKTLQRELVSMTKDGVLNKTGEKRWTQYSIKKLAPSP